MLFWFSLHRCLVCSCRALVFFSIDNGTISAKTSAPREFLNRERWRFSQKRPSVFPEAPQTLPSDFQENEGKFLRDVLESAITAMADLHAMLARALATARIHRETSSEVHFATSRNNAGKHSEKFSRTTRLASEAKGYKFESCRGRLEVVTCQTFASCVRCGPVAVFRQC